MIKVNIKTPSPSAIAKRLNGLITAPFIAKINSDVIPEIKKLVASGQSPVDGYGRFPMYKNKDKYPGKRKSARPVNLDLTGVMMSKYDAHQVSTSTKIIGIGYQKITQELEGKIIGNNEGKKGIPLRRFIPLNGESFTVSVIRKLKDVYARRISELFK
ncbi:MAG TPA: hypothetical protein VIY47_03530 [Ignavibacteriaceae bacterium]